MGNGRSPDITSASSQPSGPREGAAAGIRRSVDKSLIPITLDDLRSDTENPNEALYRDIAQRNIFNPLKTRSAKYWDPAYCSDKHDLAIQLTDALKLLDGHIVCDLGCGGSSEEEGYYPEGPAFFAALRNAGVEGVRYFGFDRYILPCEDPMQDMDKARELGIEPTADITPSLHKKDMLMTLSSLRDNCSLDGRNLCVAINAIDHCIVSLPVYHCYLLDEIKRVLPSGGLVYERNSDISILMSLDDDFEMVKIFPRYGQAVLRKK